MRCLAEKGEVELQFFFLHERLYTALLVIGNEHYYDVVSGAGGRT
jgi:hypothetical protein